MSIIIAQAAIPRTAQAGRLIRDGTPATYAGTLRIARATNALLAQCCRALVLDYYETPVSCVALVTYPLGGAKWITRITPPWTGVYCAFRARTSPGINASVIYAYSRTGSGSVQVTLATYSWLALAALLDVSYIGDEEFYLELEPGIGETLYLKGVSIVETVRTSL